MKKQLACLLALIALTVANSLAATAAVGQETPALTGRELHRLFDESWEQDMQASPMFATQVGDNRFNHRLGRVISQISIF